MATFSHRHPQDVHSQLIAAMSRLEDGVVLLAPDWTVNYLNNAICRIFEVKAEETVGLLLDRSVFGRIDRDLGRGIATIVERNGTWRGRFSFKDSEGKDRHVQASVSTILAQGGDAGRGGYAAIVRDVTADRRQEIQLEHARKMEAVGTLAGGIAHEFNNILAAVIGFAELAEMDAPGGSELAENINEILIAGKRARDLVKQILTFSRQEEGLSRPFALKPIVSESLRMIRASLPSTIEIKRSLSSSASIVGDPAEVHQVLMQLCTNALMAMRARGGVLGVGLMDVEVDAEKAATVVGLLPGTYLALSVSDTGIGMSPDLCARVFDPFFTTRAEGEGRGLGLSVVHGIVTRVGGAIGVESSPGRGSTFTVYWPGMYEQDFEEMPAWRGELPGGSERVLFVDDEEMLVALAQKNLRELGYRVTALTCPVEALELFRKDPDGYDLVITDVTMPKMTGTQLAKELLELRPGLPIILCTGFCSIINGDDASSLGVSALVAKPMAIGEFSRLMRSVLPAARELI